MKPLILLLAMASAAMGQMRTNVSLGIDYPPAELTNVTFYYYGTTNLALPVGTWPVVAVSGGRTNAPTSTIVEMPLAPGQYFFSVRASNYWGLNTNFSNVAATPAPPRSDILLQVR